MEKITNKSKEKIVNCENNKIKAGNIVLQGDEEYFEAYFDICRIYLIKRSILKKLKNPDSKLGLSIKERFKGRIVVLNNNIQKQEAAFWQKTEDGKGRGVKFVVEEVAAKYNLDLFEKRLLLFFLSF